MAHTLQERYGKLVLAKMRKTLITKDNMIFNTRYEGNPVAGAVKVPVRGEVEVSDYNKASGVAATEGSTTYKTITITHDKAINEVIDGYDAAAVPDGIVADRLDSAGYGLAKTLDADGLNVLATQGTALEDTTALTKTTAYEAIVDAFTKLSENDATLENRWVIVKPAVNALLLKSTDYVKQSNISQELVAKGVVGQVGGFNVFISNNMPTDVEFIAGHSDYCTRINEWAVPVHIQDLNGSGSFIGASAVQGRMVYEHAVTEPKGILVKKVAG